MLKPFEAKASKLAFLTSKSVVKVSKSIYYDMGKSDLCVAVKALRNWEIFISEISKQLWELTKLMKQLIVIIIGSFVITKNNES